MNVGRRNPRKVSIELEAGQAAIEVRRQVQRENEREQRNHQREDADVAIPPREEQQQQSADRGSEGDQRQNILVEPVHCVRTPIQTM